jgi:hypothetical protein
MSDKKTQDAVTGEPEKDVATDTQIIEAASPESETPESETPEDVSSEEVSSEVESSEVESSEVESSEAESPEAESPGNTNPSSAPASDASASLEQLLPGMLEIAEATNNAADVSRQSSAALKVGLAQVKSQADALTAASEKSGRLASRILVGAVAALCMSVLLYSFISVQLATRVTQVDSMLVAMSKRIVQMNSALAAFTELRTSIGAVADTQERFSNRQMLLIEAVSRAEVSARSMADDVPSMAAQQVGEKTDQIVAQVSSLSADLEGQGGIVSALTKSVSALSTQMKSLEGQVGNVKQLNADVEALIVLEREKYLEVLQRQVALDESRQRDPVSEEPERAPSVVTYSAVK